jgi:two-component system, chemotaxis family, CheB/CheR fusion protein
LVQQWLPASLLVSDEGLEILQLSVGAGRFLQLAAGVPSRHLFSLVHPELRAALRAAWAEATRTGLVSTVSNVPWTLGVAGKLTTVRVIPGGQLAPGVRLVTFERADLDAEVMLPVPAQETQQLERELEQTRGRLDEVVHDRDSWIEGLSRDNAELETLNEELQVALEELESSRMEFESANLELTTLNRELAYHLAERSRANSDLQNLMAATAIAIVFLDRNLRIMRFTPTASELFHLIDADVGRPLSNLQHTLAYPELLSDAKRVLQDGLPVERQLQDVLERYFLVRWLPYRGSHDRNDGVVLTLVDITEKQQAQRVVRGERARTELQKRLVQAQEQERGRISRELHDGVGQQLTALMLGLKQLEDSTDPSDDAHANLTRRLRALRSTAQQIGREIHELALALRPTALDDLGLLGALNNHLENWVTTTGISLDFHAVGLDEARLANHVETTVYRVAQEALNNVAKHASATSISITLERRNDELLAVIEDDGVGFEEAALDMAGGGRLGLAGMRERAALVGGTLTVDSSLGKGTTLILRIPIANLPAE